ncbi:MAG: peptide ABC transporter substrate-binding protein [Candidatus Eremiobacteraeota bacterium]|nr:peptide ABC transporter substrate-binding protein [Candidatus Eremiobacteraeota bacterium]
MTCRQMLGCAIVIAACAGIAGCSKVAMQATPGSHARHPWTVPGVLRVGFYEDLDNLNPLLSLQSFVGNVEQLVYSGLVEFDDHNDLIPDAATQVPSLTNGGISADGRTIVYHLRHNIAFSDGVALTSADVKYTWQQVMNPLNNLPNRVPSDQVVTMDTPDPYTVVVHLKAPYAPFISNFFENGGTPNGAILPKHLLQGYRDLNQIPFNSHPVGSGPFVVDRWEPGNELTLRANPRYFRGRPALQTIQIKIIPNQNSLLTALRSHEVDFYYAVSEVQYATLNGAPGIRVTVSPTFSIEHIKFNCQSPLLKDVIVRRAVAHGIDWHRLFTDVYLGLGTAGMADIRPGTWAYNPHATQYSFDPALSRALLQSDGWRMGSGGIFWKNGVPLRLQMMTVVGVSSRLKAEELVQQQLKGAGIDVEIHNYPANLVFATWASNGLLTRGRYDLALVTMDLNPDPENSINFSPDELPPTGQNRSFYVDAQLGAWENAARSTYYQTLRRKYYWLTQQRIRDAVPIHGIEWSPLIDAVNDDLQHFKPGSINDFWNAYEWSI